MDQLSTAKKPVPSATDAKVESQAVDAKAPPVEVKGAAGVTSNRSALRASIKREAPTSADSIEIVAGETVLDPATLKKMFLLGKLTQGQLAHEMKKYNDVVADSQIKFGKKDFTQTIDYRDVGRASVQNPGGDFRPDQENNSPTRTPPKDSKEARKEASSSDNDKVKRDLEKKETTLKEQETLTTNRRLNEFTDAQAEQKKQHASREAKKREEENLAAETVNPLETSVDRAANASARPKLTKNLAVEIKEELEKIKGGPVQSSR